MMLIGQQSLSCAAEEHDEGKSPQLKPNCLLQQACLGVSYFMLLLEYSPGSRGSAEGLGGRPSDGPVPQREDLWKKKVSHTRTRDLCGCLGGGKG